MFNTTYRIYNLVAMVPVLVDWQKRACIVVPKIKIS